jgi:hypothetical protein
VQTLPVEFTNVPPGLTITAQSTNTLEVWLRGNQFLLDTVDLNTLVARCDLNRAHAGTNAIPLADAFDLPSGITVERLAPRQVQVRLESTSAAQPRE